MYRELLEDEMQPQPTVIVSQPYVIANGGSSLTVGVKSTRGLGIAQIIIGSLTILLGIITVALLNHWAAYFRFAIWGGIWVVIGGILGVCSAANTSSANLNWTNMAFAIISTCIMFGDFIIYCIAVREMRYSIYSCNYPYHYTNNCYYTRNSAGIALYSCLLALSAAEFGIALTVAICCCEYGCSGCCHGEARRMVVQQPHMVPSSVVVQSSAQTSYQGGYSATLYPVASYPADCYPHAFVSSVPPAYAVQQQGT